MSILDLLVKSLLDEPITEIENWPSVLNELKDHCVFCLPYYSIRNGHCLTDLEFKSYQTLCYQSIAKNLQLLSEQKRMLELLEENIIPAVVLKGAAAAMYYPHPEYRTMGDIDIIVKPEDFENAMQMLEINYKSIQTLAQNPRHASYISKTGVVIELHKYFSFGNRNKKKDLLDQLIYAGIDNREWQEVCGYRFPCLPAIENGLVLLNHIYQHLQENGIGYRQIIDFREFVVNEKSHISEFLEAAEQVGLKKLAEALIYIYDHYMGTDIGAAEVNEAVVKELMQEITQAGNFGIKESMNTGKRSEIVIRNAKNPIEMMGRLQSYGRNRWRATEKFMFLRPFAWIYQVGYYINQVRINGGFSVILEGKRRLSKKEKMLRMLGL